MKNANETEVSEQVKKVVAGCIARKEWRSSALDAATAYVRTRQEREAVKAYVTEQYRAAGAGPMGRWQ